MYFVSGRRRKTNLHVGYTITFCGALFTSLVLITTTEAKPVDQFRRLVMRSPRSQGTSDEYIEAAKLTPQQVLSLLLGRYRFRSRVQSSHHQPRMIQVQEFSEKDKTDLCAKSASVNCAKDVLQKLEQKQDIDAKCTARKEFLECIDVSRRDCKTLMNNGIYPTLPISSEIKSIREKVGKALWTSGACVLTNS